MGDVLDPFSVDELLPVGASAADVDPSGSPPSPSAEVVEELVVVGCVGALGLTTTPTPVPGDPDGDGV